MDILQAVNALGAIVLIMIGSAWLKQHLRQYAG
jgi:hypothetical protein